MLMKLNRRSRLTLHRETIYRLNDPAIRADGSNDCQKTFDCPRPTVVDCGHTEGGC